MKIALLFGSRSEDGGARVHPQSDYDFAVILDKTVSSDWGLVARLRVDLGTLLKLPDEDFDIVDLEIAKPQMVKSIAAGFKIIKGDVDAVRSILARYHSDS